MLKTLWLIFVLLPLHCWAVAPLQVGFFDVAPYVISAKGKSLSGPYVDWARALAKEAGMEPVFTLLPFARIPLSLDDRSIDMTLGFPTAELDRAGLRLGELITIESVVVTSATRPASTVAQLKGYRLGRARGGCQDLAVRIAAAPEQGPVLVDVTNFGSGLRMLALGRLDGLCLTRNVLDHYAKEAGIDRKQLGPEILIGRRAVVLYVRRSLDAQTLDRLRTAFTAIRPTKLDPSTRNSK